MEAKPEIPARRVVNDAGKSEWRVGRRGLKVVEELAARGVAVATIAKALRMGKDAFRNVRERQPEVQEALDRGRAKEHDALVAKLYETAMEGNVIAGMFLLKARHSYREGEPLEGGGSAVQVNINLPSAMTPEDYRKMVDVTPSKEPD
ncbi:hypothetical protein FLO80_10565 [Aquicoccus porphyridii]|uniref:Uncharacterized protein n=1 Tax=Aquicoccus porphyridii TaxID=1852029 RepID=A0A5A9ZG83_9RHOB|nr:hypothetical protein [Aquicoccus porphyridii]KAA0916160.1 hypothetical protein FLO80_10565 [Aquicoccus porphyridii]RAI52798.1 hypothetical protein DOO74_16770 [Rhodobacteraceae bacterium AsT-22]